MKLITPAVFDLITMSTEGSFPGGSYFGEVGLAPFHDFDDEISQEIKDKIEEARLGLEDGSIEVEISE
jgi:basic membrane protein A